MLTKLRIKNFKSFKNDTIIDFTKTNYKILSDTNTYNDVLKGGIFVGANASGKTNAIKAISKLLELLFAEKMMFLDNDKCLFSNETNILLEYHFKINTSNIKYTIEYDCKEKSITLEKLYLNNQLILNRIGENGESEITENKIFKEVDNNSLLLREIYFNTKFRGHDILKDWFDFLLNSIFLNAYHRTVFTTGQKILDFKEYVKSNGVDFINEFFNELEFDQNIEYANKCKGKLTEIIYGSNEEKSIFFKRKGVGEPIPYPMESLGNQNLLNILPSFFHTIKNSGMLIIDGFSNGFHNKLEELLIRYFMKNSKQSQIFIVTHSTNLLTHSLLRPDQIFTTTFNGSNGSFIKRASEERPREAQNLEKMYLGGVFGGLPIYNDEE
ncbi:ATP-binding protein [Herbivorax sp. ANBcel31]|uniref:AAA family ATPase n=1 Tax=Herbivorax sp. ANBcel31 TaxID=3069754 RepID=UPI0027AFD2D9|nr:ATP-binding protein [Herbivorax sp. ANBcel31]MDQ2087920.1 ATP-binding protein [Herbivorax sp. ANBcel31]